MLPLSNIDGSPESLLDRARKGDSEALGRLLEMYRNYLGLLARTQIGNVLRLRLDASDLVQETFLEAHRDFKAFVGSSEKELVTWLRRILVRNLTDQARRQQALKREHDREESLEAMLERSSAAVHQALAAEVPSPSAQEARRERAVLFSNALASLPPDYQEVMILRHLERLKFEEVANRMAISAGAARMLWVRAMEKLRDELADRA